MRITHIVPRYCPYVGGVEVLVKELCYRLATKGFEVSVFTTDREGLPRQEWMNGVLIKRYMAVFSDPLYVPSPFFLKDLRKSKTDILHVHNVHTLLPAFVALAKMRSQKLVLQPHYHRRGQNVARNILFSIYKYFLKKYVLRYFDLVIVNSEYEELIFRKDFPNFPSKVVLVPEEYSIMVPSQMKWNPTLRPKKILYVGALRRYKNIDILIRAFKVLNLREKDLELTIIGDGPDKKRLLRLSLELEVYDRIVWKRDLPYDRLLHEYSRASAVVLLSRLESFSRVAREALSIGVPLVVYNFGVLRTLVRRGLAKGVDSLSPLDVANALDDVLSMGWASASLKMSSGRKLYADFIIKVYEGCRLSAMQRCEGLDQEK